MTLPDQKPIFYNSSPGTSLMVGLFLMLATATLGIAISGWVISHIGGKEAIEGLIEGGIETHDPWKLLLIRLRLGIINFFWFGMAGLIWARMVAYKTFTVLKLTIKPPAMMVILAIVIMIASLPLVEFFLFSSEQFSLPESLAWLETRIENAENRTVGLELALLQDLTPMGIISNVLVFAMIPAIAEEIFFRGFLLQNFRRMWSVHAAVWVSAAVFSFIHMQFLGFLSRLLMGAMLGYFVVYSGSLWTSILAHFSFNFLNVIIAFIAFNGWLGDVKMDEKLDIPFYMMALSVALTGYLFYHFINRSRDKIPNSTT